MTLERNRDDQHTYKVREWLLSLLRFAVTRGQSDHALSLAMADALDSTNGQWWPAAPRFFTRTTDEVCAAVITTAEWRDSAVLRTHAERIDDPRLRRAFQAAVGLPETSAPQLHSEKGSLLGKADIWRGLPHMPIELDDAAEGHHENPAQAILLALIETHMGAHPEPRSTAVSSLESRQASPLNCDNFA